jgi:transposase
MLEGVLEQEPQTLGYAFTIWTVDRLRAHLEQQTGIGLSASRFRVLLQERGYVYRQPKHDLSALQDPAAREGAKRLLDELKKVTQRRV